jgi:two-component system sensor histidine kinase CreC
MSRRTRIFLGVFAVYVAVVGFLLYRVSADLDPRYRESAEESLVDTANLLATLLERRAYSGTIPTDELERTLEQLARRPVYARIFGIEKTRVDLHVYVTNRDGVVLFDSRGRDVGTIFLDFRDVWLTLQGAYGARTSRADPEDPDSVTMYVGAAIRERRPDVNLEASEDIIGMVSVGKPVTAFSPFIANARSKLVLFGAISVGAFAVLLLLATLWLVRPFGLVRDVWRAVRREGGSPLVLGRQLLAAVRAAFAEVRDTLAGRTYVDQYVQTLAHELKSPLAAIRGAAELLAEPMPPPARARFASNIAEQVSRAQGLIDQLLELSALERRGVLERVEPVSVAAVAAAARDELAPVAQRRGVAVEVEVDPALSVRGDPFLLQRALVNLLRNAVEFAPPGTQVQVDAGARRGRVVVEVRDRGPGLPPYAAARVFERFFSLPRPDTGKRSTGLGLALVKEVAALHGGAARLVNREGGGALASLDLPAAAG